MIRIRQMILDDLPLGMRLKAQAGWNQTEADWRRFLALEPDGCFVAEWDGRSVATTTTCVFGTVAWIAMVLVDKPARHQGIATRLVQHALDWLDRRGVLTVRLDATPQGRPVYQRLGFVAEYDLVRYEGMAAAGCDRQDAALAARRDRDAIAELDRCVMGTDRRRLLERLLDEYPTGAYIVRRGSEIQGYALHRPGSRAAQIGPAVAIEAQAGGALLDACLAPCRGRPVFVDIPCDNAAASRWAAERGLVAQRPFTRMRRGQRVHDRPDQLWASSGPEKG